MQDFGTLLDAHDCAQGRCSRRSHTQDALVSPQDVATPAEEIKLLAGVRDCLVQRGFRMLEMEPTPRFDASRDGTPKQWAVRFEAISPGLPGAGCATSERRPTRFAFLRKMW